VMVAVDDYLVSGYADVEAHGELLALVMVTIPFVDHDVAAHDARMEFLELCRLGANARLDRIGAREIAECDLQRSLHGGPCRSLKTIWSGAAAPATPAGALI